MAKEKNTLNKIEREYTIPLREKCRSVPRYKKANKAIKTIKEFLVRHMKIRDRDLNKIKLDKYLNEAVWFRGIKKPPIKIKVRAVKEGDIVKVELAEMPEKLKFKKLREEKTEKKAVEKIDKKKVAKIKEDKDKAKEEAEKTAPKGVHQGGASSSSSPSVNEDLNTEGKEAEKTDEEKKENIKKEKEKKSAIVEAGEKRGKAAAKQMKHQIGGKTKQPKRQIRKALEK